jgi:oligopeptide transport system substrate-binding protein
MKKILSFALALAICVMCFAGCSQIDPDDGTGKGAIIDMYIGTKVYDLDPALTYTDESTSKILSLIFEGLMKVNKNGKLEKALMKDYELEEVELDDGTTRWEMDITINTTHWSDGSLVQTNDIIYAWKRILDPKFQTEAAAMLYCIDGAEDRKMGKVSEDDIGIYSSSKSKMTIQFKVGVTEEMIDEFLYNLASLALVPVRETKVKAYPDTWSKASSDLSTNGPFKVSVFSNKEGMEKQSITLERSKYYYLSQETDSEAIDKFVTPYRLVFHFEEPLDRTCVYSEDAVTDIIDMIKANKLFYAGNLTGKVLDNFNESDVKYNKVASTYTYFFNMAEGKVGSNPTIRKALSAALNRAAIAESLRNGAEAATGLIPSMIFDTKKGTSFREAVGNIIPTGDAKAMLAAEGIDPSKYEPIYLYYITDTTNDSYQSNAWGYASKEKTIAMAAKQVWEEELGFKVVLKGVTAAEHARVYESGEYDIIGLDYHMASAYATAALSPFAKAYSGRVSIEEKGANLIYTQLTHATGYYNEAYDALIKTAMDATTQKDRAAALHDAEKLLVNTEAAVIPVIFNSEAYVSSALSDIDTTFWGINTFTKTYLNNYVEHNNNAGVDANAGTDEAAD